MDILSSKKMIIVIVIQLASNFPFDTKIIRIPIERASHVSQRTSSTSALEVITKHDSSLDVKSANQSSQHESSPRLTNQSTHGSHLEQYFKEQFPENNLNQTNVPTLVPVLHEHSSISFLKSELLQDLNHDHNMGDQVSQLKFKQDVSSSRNGQKLQTTESPYLNISRDTEIKGSTRNGSFQFISTLNRVCINVTQLPFLLFPEPTENIVSMTKHVTETPTINFDFLSTRIDTTENSMSVLNEDKNGGNPSTVVSSPHMSSNAEETLQIQSETPQPALEPTLMRVNISVFCSSQDECYFADWFNAEKWDVLHMRNFLKSFGATQISTEWLAFTYFILFVLALVFVIFLVKIIVTSCKTCEKAIMLGKLSDNFQME